jgi:hypothetical protein
MLRDDASARRNGTDESGPILWSALRRLRYAAALSCDATVNSVAARHDYSIDPSVDAIIHG